MANIVTNPFVSTQPAGSTLSNDFTGHTGEKLVADVHGRYYNSCYRNGVYTFTQAAVTVPVNATTLASKFAIYNPVGSGRNMELISCDALSVVATTVVSGLGLYYSTGTNATGSTFTTPGTIINGFLGATMGSVMLAYSALTHVGTPVLATLMQAWGAVTTTAENIMTYNFDGKIIVPPGTVISLAMTTAASTASGITLALAWAEHPI